MLWLMLTLVLILLGLVVFFWVGSFFIQGYFYEGPTPDLYWRAPAAAAAVTLFLAFFCLLAKKFDVNTLFSFTSGSEKPFDSFYSIRNGKETHYVKDKRKGAFVDDQGKPWRWNDSEGVVDTIVVVEGDQRLIFRADLGSGGKPKDAGKPVQFLEEGRTGRYIVSDELGIIAKAQGGRTFMMVFINLVHFVVWFLAIWLLLEYQWPHAFLLALPFWAATTLLVLPGMIDKLAK